jgi:hypothetical protein
MPGRYLDRDARVPRSQYADVIADFYRHLPPPSPVSIVTYCQRGDGPPERWMGNLPTCTVEAVLAWWEGRFAPESPRRRNRRQRAELSAATDATGAVE